MANIMKLHLALEEVAEAADSIEAFQATPTSGSGAAT